MIIDFHTHIADLRRADALEHPPASVETLLARLDDEGIDKAVVLPLWPNPEGIHLPFLWEAPTMVEQVRLAAAHRERLIAFGNLDPRMAGNTSRAEFGWALERFCEMGCAGIGEVTANIPADDPRVINLFRQCGAWQLPVVIHVTGPGEGYYGLIDPVGLPGLERLLTEVPETVVCGHGPGFWAEIGTEIDDVTKSGYPKGPLPEEGALWRAMRAYPNLYADISANSGYNALTRDPEVGLRFLHEFQDRILFATDVCFAGPDDRMPHQGWLNGLLAEGRISSDLFDKVMGGNALRILTRLG